MRFNVLVVDDSAVMRRMVIRALQMSGLSIAEVHQAGDGSEALEVVGKNWIDLALVDINMPVMNGEAFVAEVRRRPETRDLAIVMVTTDRSAARAERLKGLGAAFVHKPFTPEVIRDAVQVVLGIDDEGYSNGNLEDHGLDF